jgi:hypothetical protein
VNAERDICPVCYFVMSNVYDADEICPCCGTQFGHDDSAETEAQRAMVRAELRLSWIERGQPFWYAPLRPSGWNPAAQAGGRVSFADAPPRPLERRSGAIMPVILGA